MKKSQMTSSLGWSTLVVTLVAMVSVGMADDCSPAVEKCVCGGAVVECTNLDLDETGLPSAFDGITDYIFTNCKIGGHITTVDYPKAKILELDNCMVTQVDDGAFETLSNLQYLAMPGNGLKTLNKETFRGLNSLTSLSLSDNQLTELTADVFSHIPGLKELDLAKNEELKISDITFTSCPSLSILTLTEVGLTEIPISALEQLSGLTSLTLDRNAFKELPGMAFSGLGSNLMRLSIDSCTISRIDDHAFDGLEKVSFLNMGFNGFSTLSTRSMEPMKGSLKEILLRGNKLTTLEEATLPGSQLSKIHLGQNPWHCDCALQWMTKLHLDQIDDEENVTCSTPDSLSGLNLQNVTMEMSCECEDGRCDGGKGNTVALAIAIPILIICALLIGYYVYRIVQNRRRSMPVKGHRYSAVYKDTVEASNPKTQPLADV